MTKTLMFTLVEFLFYNNIYSSINPCPGPSNRQFNHLINSVLVKEGMD